MNDWNVMNSHLVCLYIFINFPTKVSLTFIHLKENFLKYLPEVYPVQ